LLIESLLRATALAALLSFTAAAQDVSSGLDTGRGEADSGADQPIPTDRPDRIASRFNRRGSNWESKTVSLGTGSSGNFRVHCGFASIEQTDPILQEEQSPRSRHMHSFFGSNIDVGVETGRNELLEHPRSNCAGGGINRSLYWVPTMVAVDDDPSTDHRVIEERDFVAYYKTELGLYGADNGVEVLPEVLPEAWFNLRMIAHRLSTEEMETLANYPYNYNRRVGTQWKCYGANNVQLSVRFGSMPDCGPGRLNLQIWFPQCLNTTKQPRGTDAENPMHYTREGQEVWLRYATRDADTLSGCPADGDEWVRIPTQSYSISWRVPPEGMSNWYLASDLDADGMPKGTPRGATAHGDFMNGWSQSAPIGEEGAWDHKSVAQTWYEDCYLALRNCTNQVKSDRNGRWRYLTGGRGLLFTD